MSHANAKLEPAEEHVNSIERGYQRIIASVIMRAIIDHMDNLRIHRYDYQLVDGENGRMIRAKRGKVPPAETIRRAEMCNAGLWILSDSDAPFSYLWCCEVIGLDPQKFRDRMNSRMSLKEVREFVKSQEKYETRVYHNESIAI